MLSLPLLVYVLRCRSIRPTALLNCYLLLQLCRLLPSLGGGGISFLTSLNNKSARAYISLILLLLIAFSCRRSFICLDCHYLVLFSYRIPDLLEQLCLAEGPWKCGLTLCYFYFCMQFELLNGNNSSVSAVVRRRRKGRIASFLIFQSSRTSCSCSN